MVYIKERITNTSAVQYLLIKNPKAIIVLVLSPSNRIIMSNIVQFYWICFNFPLEKMDKQNYSGVSNDMREGLLSSSCV